MNTNAILKRTDQILNWLLPTTTLLYVCSLFFPWLTGTQTSVDASWEMALHAAVEHHWQFGHDIIFTFGPWGMLYGGYSPGTFPVSVAIWIIFALIFWWAGWRVAGYFSVNRLAAWVWFMVFAGLSGMRIEQTIDVRTTAWALLLLILYFFAEDKPFTARQCLLVLMGGVLSLIKFTGFIESVIVIGVISADIVFRRRRFPLIAIVFAGSLLFFWLAAGQHLYQLGSYLRYSFMVAGGYTRGMMMSGPGEFGSEAATLVASMVLMGIMGYAAWQRRRWFGVLPLAGLAALLFLSFKLGSVRFHPIHEITTSLQMLVAALACLAVVWPALKKNPFWLRATFTVPLLGVYLLCSAKFSHGYRQQHFPHERLWEDFAWTLNLSNLTVPARLVRDPEYLSKAYQRQLAKIRKAFPLPAIEGSVDVYPWRQAVLFAHKLHYDPRPVIQSYSAYTPQLALLNAKHLQGDGAPDNVLFDVDPQNHNYPALEDGLSWPELLTRYDIIGTNGQFILMKHAPQPRKYHLTLLTNTLAAWGEPVKMPANGGPIWAEVKIQPTFWGNIVATLYKPTRLLLAVSLSNGRQKYFNLVPGMAEGGFLLSPYISDRASFVSLATTGNTKNLSGMQVISAAIVPAGSDGSTADYQLPVRWRLYEFHFPRQNLNKSSSDFKNSTSEPKQ